MGFRKPGPEIEPELITTYGFYCSQCGYRWTLDDLGRFKAITYNRLGEFVRGPLEDPGIHPGRRKTPESCPSCESPFWWVRASSGEEVREATQVLVGEAQEEAASDAARVAALASEIAKEQLIKSFYTPYGEPTRAYVKHWRELARDTSLDVLAYPIQSTNNIARDDLTTVALHYRQYEVLYAYGVLTLGHLIVLTREELLSFDGLAPNGVDLIAAELARYDSTFLLRPPRAGVPRRLAQFRERPPPKPVSWRQHHLLFGERLTIDELAQVADTSASQLTTVLLNARVRPQEAIGQKFFENLGPGKMRRLRSKSERAAIERAAAALSTGTAALPIEEKQTRYSAGLQKVMDFVRTRGEVSTGDVAAEFNIHVASASRYLTQGVKRGLFKRVKMGRYAQV